MSDGGVGMLERSRYGSGGWQKPKQKFEEKKREKKS
jgi:hypothetical protein